MTNEEAIKILTLTKKLEDTLGNFDGGIKNSDLSKSLAMAIEALEQEPKIVPIAEIKFDDDTLHEIVEGAVKNIEIEPKWIPVSERLPEKPGTYMTTADYGKYGLSVRRKYYYGQGLGWSYDCVIAWMPLPEPYKAESEEK